MCYPACPGLPWDRSVAQWRDLQFNGPLLEMFSTGVGDLLSVLEPRLPRLAVGNVFTLRTDRAGNIHLASIHGLDSVITKFPVLRIRNKPGRFRLNIQVVEPKVIQRGVGLCADIEGLGRPGCLDVPDVYIAEMR
jgi:hypothetical protein